MDDVRPIGDPQCFPDVVVGDEDPDPAILQMENDLLDVGDRNRIDPCERFVEEHEER